MTHEEREGLIDECVNMEANIHGILPIEIDREGFEILTDDQLKAEYDWLYDLAYLK